MDETHFWIIVSIDFHEVSECYINDFMSGSNDERLKKYFDYSTDSFINLESLFPPQYWDCFINIHFQSVIRWLVKNPKREWYILAHPH